ncbi:MAG: Gfo/Idh/MocA family oxidoreductase [Candidatus Melainabacteria bacterium]|nr:Gfo/Idh/MocA family oxidoreductase [Candidatus Melainabacteria bacterium]
MVTTNIALIGCGSWGKNLARNLFDLKVLNVVCDADPVILEDVRQKYPGIKVSTSYSDIVSDPDVNAIVIATPSHTHYALARIALLAGKHVYVEKPLARGYMQAQELNHLASVKNLTLMVGHLLLYHPVVNMLRQLIFHGELGEIRFLNSDRRNFNKRARRDNNVIWDLAPHDISMMSYILGLEPMHVESASGWSTNNDSVIDVAHIDLAFPGDIPAHIHNSWIDPQKQVLLTVNGSKKTAVLNDTRTQNKLELYFMNDEGRLHIEELDESLEEPLKVECEHFVHCIKTGDAPRSDGTNGYQVVKILEEAEQKMHVSNRERILKFV